MLDRLHQLGLNVFASQKVYCPVLVMHGEIDRTIPIQHSRKVDEAALAPKISLWVKDAEHDSVSAIADERYDQALLSFQKLIDRHH